MEAVSGLPALALPTAPAVEQMTWDGRTVEWRLDHWNGRFTDTTRPAADLAALHFPAADWTAASLGNGFFSLSTPGASVAEVIAWEAATPGLCSLEPDIVMQASSVPNDPLLASQWSLANAATDGFGVVGADIHAAGAWDVTTGSRNVVVAVIDSGIDLTHPDLAANIWTNPGEIAGNGIDDDHDGFVDDVHGWNFAANTADVQDGYGHGTHVSGIIGAVGNNGAGVTGINWQVSIMPLKFQDNFGVGNTGGAIAAVNYLTMMRRDFGIDVVVANNSWGGGTGTSSLLREAIRAAGDAGITFVAAAGNSAVNCDASPRYPACYDLPNVISVAASDRYDNLAGFSNYGGATIDLAAPGVGIYSTLPGGIYGYLSGTSQAAPQVTGVVALLAAVKPDITVAQVRAAILGSVDPVPGLAGKVVTGGRLDAATAVASLVSQAFMARVRIASSHPLTGAVDSITISFNRPVTSGLTLADLTLTRNGTPLQLDGATLTTTDSITWTVGDLAALTAPAGNYSLTLSTTAATSGITSTDGAPLAAFSGTNWTMANRLPVGTIESATPVAVQGWALDPNAGSQPVAVQLWVDGRLSATVLAAAARDDLRQAYGSPDHGYAIAMPPLPIGNHVVEVKAYDPETGLFLSLGQRIVAVQPPVGAVQVATTSRLAGWAFSSRAGAAPIVVRVVINGRVYGSYTANVPRPDLLPRVGSPNHGYDIPLNPAVFRRGWNLVRVWAIDPLTGRPTLLGGRNIWR